MINALNFWLIAISLLLVMLALLEIGRRIGIHRHCVDPEGASAGLGAIDGAVFGLMGLLIATIADRIPLALKRRLSAFEFDLQL